MTQPESFFSGEKDSIFSEPLARVGDFRFTSEVSAVFDDMAQRSIPYYAEVRRMCAELAFQFYQSGSQIYDLGFSTGTMATELSGYFQSYPYIYTGLDNSPAMVEKARELSFPEQHQVSFKEADISRCEYEASSVIIANYTFQFIRPMERAPLMRRLYQSLLPGGVLLISEKVLEGHSDTSRLFTRLYYDFKKRNGYSELEISQKREALENILVPYRLDENIQLLQDAGFYICDVFFKWYNFASLIAIKKS